MWTKSWNKNSKKSLAAESKCELLKLLPKNEVEMRVSTRSPYFLCVCVCVYMGGFLFSQLITHCPNDDDDVDFNSAGVGAKCCCCCCCCCWWQHRMQQTFSTHLIDFIRRAIFVWPAHTPTHTSMYTKHFNMDVLECIYVFVCVCMYVWKRQKSRNQQKSLGN